VRQQARDSSPIKNSPIQRIALQPLQFVGIGRDAPLRQQYKLVLLQLYQFTQTS